MSTDVSTERENLVMNQVGENTSLRKKNYPEFDAPLLSIADAPDPGATIARRLAPSL
jgi:hypothetical protein